MRRWVREHPLTTGFVALFVYINLVGGIALHQIAQEGKDRDVAIREAGRKAFRQIERSRVDATRESCKQRNAERRTSRGQIDRDIETTRTLPGQVFAQFNITRAEALKNLRDDRKAVHRLDCKAAVRKVRRSSPNFSP